MSSAETNGWLEKTFPMYRIGPIPGFEVVWAGPHPFANGFCLGSANGRVLTMEVDGSQEFYRGSDTEEAINGLAVLGSHCVVSTRTGWTMWRNATPDVLGNHAFIPGGTHGVIASPSGYFVGPQGTDGLRLLRPVADKSELLGLAGDAQGSLYFYKTIALRDAAGEEMLFCAVRNDGVALAFPNVRDKELQTIGFPNWDVVDICPLTPDSFAVAALGIDGSIRLFKNIQMDKQSALLKFSEVQGKAYRLTSCRGHLILLTNKTLCIFANLAADFLQGKPIEFDPVRTTSVMMNGIDLAICQDRYLLVVNSDNTMLQIDLASYELPSGPAPVSTINRAVMKSVSDKCDSRIISESHPMNFAKA